MRVADEECLVANPDRSEQYFEIHKLKKTLTAFRVRNFFQSDRKQPLYWSNLLIQLGKI